MAIDPKLVSIKTAGELPVSDPSENANFLFYEGETLQRSPMSNIYDKVSSGLLPATTATVPEATGFHRYLVHEAGTYTNFGGIVVSAADLDVVNGVANNRVILEVREGVATKRVERVKGDVGPTVPIMQGLGNSTSAAMSQDAATRELLEKMQVAEVGGVLPYNGVVVNEGSYLLNFSDKSNAFTLEGRIDTMNGVHTDAYTGEKATDFIDIDGFSTIVSKGVVVNSRTGTAFYTASQVFISGFVNTGADQTLVKPENAKYVRACTTDADTPKLILSSQFIQPAGRLTVIKDGERTDIDIPTDVVKFAETQLLTGDSVVYQAGDYIVSQVEAAKASIAGYISVGSGAVNTSVNHKHTPKIPRNAATHLVVTGLVNDSSSNNVTFYNSSSVWIAGQVGKSANATTPDVYAFPAGAEFFQISRMNTYASTEKTIMQERVTVGENQLLFFNNGAYKLYSGGSDSVSVSGAELIADLPKSNGTAQLSGDAYIDISTGHVIVKP